MKNKLTDFAAVRNLTLLSAEVESKVNCESLDRSEMYLLKTNARYVYVYK